MTEKEHRPIRSRRYFVEAEGYKEQTQNRKWDLGVPARSSASWFPALSARCRLSTRCKHAESKPCERFCSRRIWRCVLCGCWTSARHDKGLFFTVCLHFVLMMFLFAVLCLGRRGPLGTVDFDQRWQRSSAIPWWQSGSKLLTLRKLKLALPRMIWGDFPPDSTECFKSALASAKRR